MGDAIVYYACMRAVSYATDRLQYESMRVFQIDHSFLVTLVSLLPLSVVHQHDLVRVAAIWQSVVNVWTIISFASSDLIACSR